MAKDINIHLKTTGAEQTKQQLSDVGRGAEQVGRQVQTGQHEAARATEQATGRLVGMGRVVQNLKNQVLGMVAAWLSIQGVQRVITMVIEKLERVVELQKSIYQQAVSLGQIGQSLEFQTGTTGRQRYWVQQALELQQAGGLASADAARQMMIAMDIAFARQGGIKSEQIRQLARELAPFVGAAGLGGPEVAKLFEFAGVAGIQPAGEDYKQYLAMLRAGYTASKATDFGAFMEGLQRAGTGYLAMGGTLEQAISAFVSARAVTPSEPLAATLMEQASRLAAGAYEKPRLAMEEALGVKWSDMTMDQRYAAMLRYVRGLPAAQRTERLVEAGFPAEMAPQLGKLITPEAAETMAATKMQVLQATSDEIDEMIESYLSSLAGREMAAKAEAEAIRTQHAERFADWQIRMTRAKARVDAQITEGTDRWISDKLEPHVVAFEELQQEMRDLFEELPAGPLREQARESLATIEAFVAILKSWKTLKGRLPGMPAAVHLRGQKVVEYLERLRQEQVEAEQQNPARQRAAIEEMGSWYLDYLRRRDRGRYESLQALPEDVRNERAARMLWETVQPTRTIPSQWRGLSPGTSVTQVIPKWSQTLYEQRIRDMQKAIDRLLEREQERSEGQQGRTGEEPQASVKPVSIIEETEPLEVTARAEPRPAEIEVPITPVAKLEESEPVEVTAATRVRPAEAEVPVEVAAAIPPPAEPELISPEMPERLVSVSHYYDNSIKYYPRVGDDLRGPRYSQV